VPLEIAQRTVGQAGLDGNELAVMLAAEMEPPVVGLAESIVRLVAYGKDGFSAILPAALPYRQPDFRDPAANAEPTPLPLLAVVRWVGHEDRATLPVQLARAFVTHLHAVFATHVRPDHLAVLRARAFDALDAFGAVEVPLLPLPRRVDDESRLMALMGVAIPPPATTTPSAEP
jgi:hypothetical protein